MRNPNGYGSVYKLSGKRRKPYIVRITTGWDESGKQLYRTLGYFATKMEANMALADFNKNPYTIEESTITFGEIYEKVLEEKSILSNSTITGYKVAFNYCQEIKDIPILELRKSHLQKAVDSCSKSYQSKKKIKVLFNQVYRWALENDIDVKDYSQFVRIGEVTSLYTKEPFSEKEISKLWENLDRLPYIDTVLILIYTGMRPSEMLLIENATVDLEERIMRGGIKNASSKNRIIPINRKILPLVRKWKEKGNKFLISNEPQNPMSYYTYYDVYFKRIMEQLEMKHKPHECRHTFATLMDNADANKLATKRIMGHASKDITDKVYTHKDIEQLLKAIDMI